MKSFYLFIIISITLFSCTNSPQCKDVNVVYPPELFTLYQGDENNLKLIRAFKISSDNMQVNHFSIIPGKDLKPLQQVLVKKENFPIAKKDSIKEKYKIEYSLQLAHENKMFWIQVQPTKEILGDQKDFEYRDMIEDLINAELLKNNAGIFFAGSVGHGGLDMLCHYTDERRAIESIFKILCEQGIEDHTLIVKRVYLRNDRWLHEVVYPMNYTGEFQYL